MVMRLLEVISFPSCLLYMVFSRIKDIFSSLCLYLFFAIIGHKLEMKFPGFWNETGL